MQLLATLFFVGTASAHISLVAGRSSAFLALRGVMERQADLCEPVREPYTCERSCGPGFVECIDFPTCYNPGRGDTCCSDGSYCPAGYYCTDAGCCPDENSIEECGATATLSVIPPPAKEEPTLEPTAIDKATSEAESTTSEPPEAEPTASEPSEAEPVTSTDALSVITTNATSTMAPTSNSIIATTSLAPHVTVSGGERNAQFRVLSAIGGLVAILMTV